MKRKLCLALLLGTVASWLNGAHAEANGGDVHIGGLSGGTSLAIIVIGVVVAGLFIGLFVLRWRQAAQSSTAQPREDDTGTDPESEDQKEG